MDIQNWQDGSKLLYEYAYPESKNKAKISTKFNLSGIDPKLLYALLVRFISKKPNGYFTFMQMGSKPLDNFIWWDFALSNGDMVIHIWKTCLLLEAQFYSKSNKIDISEFLNKNIKKYKKDISETLNNFETHTICINHFKSYSQCVKYLWDNIKKIKLSPPVIPQTHVMEESEMKENAKSMAKYLKNSIKFHVLGKALILNCAFMIESYIVLLIKIGLAPVFYEFDSIFKIYLRATFEEKLKALPLFSRVFKGKIDTTKKEIKDALELITLRNKYVHSDETSHHNKIGQVLFDEDFPVFGKNEVPFGLDSIQKGFHNPSLDKVKWAHEIANNFIRYIDTIILDNIKKQLKLLVEQNPIGFNEKKKIYSAIYDNVIPNFYFLTSKDKQKNS